MAIQKTYKLLCLALVMAMPVTLFPQEVIKPGAAGEASAIAAANIETAARFLRNWGFTNEADNIEKWFKDGKIILDWSVSQAETGTVSGNISLNGAILTGNEKGNPALFHKFNGADAKDKERIVKLAFTLVHEKVHAHQSFISFSYGREGNETDAYNKEITDAETTLDKMEKELNKAINAGDTKAQKQLREWINAVLEVKIDAITTFGNADNYPESRRLNWPDRVLEDLKELRKKNEKELDQLKVAVAEPGNTQTGFAELFAQLKAYEQTLPAKAMPAYWMEINKSDAASYVELKTTQGIKTVLFTLPEGKVKVTLPANTRKNEILSGSIKLQPNDSSSSMDADVIKLAASGHFLNTAENNFTLSPQGIKSNSGVVLTLLYKTLPKGLLLVPFNTMDDVNHAFNEMKIPAVGMQGAPLTIPGPFDGNYENTTCTIGQMPAVILAESPRGLTIHPGELKGLISISVKDGTIEKQGFYRAVGLHMNISKTNLKKGEQASIYLEADGLEGLLSPVFIRLETQGNVSVKKGNLQYIAINPADVKPNGTWSATRTLIGVESGGFEVTASIEGKNP